MTPQSNRLWAVQLYERLMSETEGAATSGLSGIQRVYSLSASPKHQLKRYPSNLAKSQYTAATFLIHQNEKKNDSVDLQIFLPFPFWSVTEEGVLHLLNTSSNSIRKFPCIFLINRNIYHIFQIFEVLVSWAFSWQYNPSMAHGFIMVYLLLEAALGSMKHILVGSRGNTPWTLNQHNSVSEYSSWK